MISMLDVLIDRELRSRSTTVRRQDGVAIQVDGVEKTIGFDCPNVDENIDLFDVWCVRPANSAESAVRAVKDREGDGKTLGYIFPITTFSADSDYSASKLPGRYAPLFAGVGALAIVEHGLANSHLKLRFEDLAEETPLRELFDADLAVVVIGRANLSAVGASASDVRLLVQESGYFIADIPPEYSWVRPSPVLPGDSCVLGRISPDASDVVDLISRIISLAADQTSAVSSLLIYYQVVEILSERVLGARLRRLAASPPSDAWELKEALRDAVSESSRVKQLCQQAQVDEDAYHFDQLRLHGLQILQVSASPVKENASAAEVLYSVRNLVVHNQKVLGAKEHILLKDFVSSLHSSVFAMVRRLSISSI